MSVETVNQVVELLFADVGRRAAAKVSKSQLSSLKSAGAAVAFHLLDESIEIDANLFGVLVCIDFEIAKLATLAAKRNVQIKAERFFDTRWLGQCFKCFRHELRLPLREGRIIRNKIIANFRICICRHNSLGRKQSRQNLGIFPKSRKVS